MQHASAPMASSGQAHACQFCEQRHFPRRDWRVGGETPRFGHALPVQEAALSVTPATDSGYPAPRALTIVPGRLLSVCVVTVIPGLVAGGCGNAKPSSRVTVPARSAAQQPSRPPRPSANPYAAGLAFAACMRAHGVPHPNPDRNGDFHLTPAQERRLKAAGHANVEAATQTCFKYLKPVSAPSLCQRRRRLGRPRFSNNFEPVYASSASSSVPPLSRT